LTQIDAIGPHELKNGADAAGGRDEAKHQLAHALLLFPLSPVCSFAQDKTAPPPSINEPLGGCPDATDPKETALFKIIPLGPMRVEKMGKLRLAGSNVEMAASAAPLSAIGDSPQQRIGQSWGRLMNEAPRNAEQERPMAYVSASASRTNRISISCRRSQSPASTARLLGSPLLPCLQGRISWRPIQARLRVLATFATR
jgi:hypothetical protein